MTTTARPGQPVVGVHPVQGVMVPTDEARDPGPGAEVGAEHHQAGPRTAGPGHEEGSLRTHGNGSGDRRSPVLPQATGEHLAGREPPRTQNHHW
jgi:hypothetical protein